METKFGYKIEDWDEAKEEMRQILSLTRRESRSRYSVT
jgi:hypothetical protein